LGSPLIARAGRRIHGRSIVNRIWRGLRLIGGWVLGPVETGDEADGWPGSVVGQHFEASGQEETMRKAQSNAFAFIVEALETFVLEAAGDRGQSALA
jgi:hypothetical protein